ncbi:MAG TPA: hypothetical protein VNH18_33790, partial [Bryobacteraceae bacterium]|nr:hypothetical protein [Bryobacteraceae bacterium]
RNVLPDDILQDPFVGCRRPSLIMFGSQSVYRYNNVQTLLRRPADRNRPKCACNDLYMDSARYKFRDKNLKLAVTNQRIATYQRQVKGPKPINDPKDSADKLFSFPIIQISQEQAVPQVRGIVCIATRTSQRTLTSDLN